MGSVYACGDNTNLRLSEKNGKLYEQRIYEPKLVNMPNLESKGSIYNQR